MSLQSELDALLLQGQALDVQRVDIATQFQALNQAIANKRREIESESRRTAIQLRTTSLAQWQSDLVLAETAAKNALAQYAALNNLVNSVPVYRVPRIDYIAKAEAVIKVISGQ